MSYLEIIDRVLEEQKKEPKQGLGDVSLLTLSQLAKRNMAIEIYSEILGCEIWVCSNEKIETQVKEDDPEAVCYTASEMIKLLRLNPTPEDIKRIHEAKSVFNGSRISGGEE